MSRRGSSRDYGAWMDRIDWVLAVRGASTGFSVLVISGLLNNVVREMNPVAGVVEIVVGVLAAAMVAAWRTRTADAPMLSGAVAALLGFTLTVPLIPLMYLSGPRIDYRMVVAAAAVTMAVGALTGLVLSRRQR